MTNRFSKLAAVVYTTLMVSTIAQAQTPHYREHVTFIQLGASFPGCLMFQTSEGGGVVGIDNYSGRDTGGSNYNGRAKNYVVGVATDSTSVYHETGAAWLTMLSTSRYSFLQTMTVNFVDWGLQSSTRTYNDCNNLPNLYAVGGIGQ